MNPPPAPVTDVLHAASGRAPRHDPVLPGSGGPAGNAQLTAWLGLSLLVLFLAELITLLDVQGLITWHLAIGALLIPPALAKTATTGWRMVRYYTGAPVYTQAGPPPLLLRLLGPLVVLGTLALLGTGTALVFVGPDGADRTLLSVLGQQVTPLTLHQASFAFWAVTTGVHVLARLLPALHLATTTPHDAPLAGWRSRIGVLVGVTAAAATVGAVLLAVATPWTSGR